MCIARSAGYENEKSLSHIIEAFNNGLQVAFHENFIWST